MKNSSKAEDRPESKDHRNIGRDHELFSFHREGPGLPFYKGNGVLIRDILKSYWKDVHRDNGYLEIESPIILDRSLWEKSGHWDLYKENMYVANAGGREFAIKPMSCPGAILVYKEKRRSFKELPLRLNELGIVHRFEDSGAIQGLLRARSFVQDDAHIFCDQHHLMSEIKDILNLSFKMLKKCGFEKFKFEISLRGSAQDKYLGGSEDWSMAEKVLIDVIKDFDIPFHKKEGEAKFYGPSIDLHIEDHHKKWWQCSCIQFDFNLAKRFDLFYMDKLGKKKVPIILHRAIFGSLERFVGLLLENYGLDLPFWICPEQIRLVIKRPCSDNYSQSIYAILKKMGYRVSIDDSDKNMSEKIKNGQADRIPFQVILGPKEEKDNVVSLRKIDGGKENGIDVEKLLQFIPKL